MLWYYVEAGKQAGPVEEAVLEEFFRTGRVQADTLVWHEGMANWQPYRQAKPAGAPGAAPALEAPEVPAAGVPTVGEIICAECGKMFAKDEAIQYGTLWVCSACKPVFVQKLKEGAPLPGSAGGAGGVGWVNEEQLLARDYRVEIGDCLERAWKTVTGNIGKVIVSCLIYPALLLLMAVPIGGIIAMVVGFSTGGNFGGGAVAAIGLLVIAFIALMLGMVVLSAGYPWFYLNLYRNGGTGFDRIFDGFRGRIGSLLGAWFTQAVINVAASIPFAIVGALLTAARPPTGVLSAGQVFVQLASTAVGIYLAMIWIYTSLLIMDKGMGFWSAMQLSRKMVSKRWWMTFLFFIVAGLIAGAGGLVCLVGLLVTVPVFLAMKACLYDDNFRDLEPRTF